MRPKLHGQGNLPADDAKCDGAEYEVGRSNAGDYRRWLGMQFLFFEIILVGCSIGDEKLRELPGREAITGKPG